MNGLALFAGAAGLELGIKSAFPNARTVCYVEGEAFSASILVTQMEKGGLDPAPIWSNVITFDGKPWRGKVDFISAGFPCQPWSIAGKQEGIKDERWLWGHIIRIIGEVRPRFVFLENVPGLLNGGASPVFGSLASLGFNCEWSTLRASKVGAPHHRDRVFILAARPEEWGSLADAQRARLEGRRDAGQSEERESGHCGAPSNTVEDLPLLLRLLVHQAPAPRPRMRMPSHRRMDGEPLLDWWAVEPRLGRMADRVADRVDRLRAIGNGVVPQQASAAYGLLALRGGGLID